MKKKFETIASIDIGSNYLRMSIVQVNSDGTVHPLEGLVTHTDIGRDTFSMGKIGHRTIRDACASLKGFAQVMKEYGVTRYKAVATSGVREAENREYVLAQIKQATTLDVEGINIAQERYYTLKAMGRELRKSELMAGKTTLIVNITSGGIEVIIYDKGSLTYSEHIKLGALRIRETLLSLESRTSNFAEILSEYFEYKTYMTSSKIRKMSIDTMIGMGTELSAIRDIIGAKPGDGSSIFILDRSSMARLYERVSRMTPEAISDKFKLSRKQAEVLIPSLVIYNAFMDMSGANGIACPDVSLGNGIIYDMADRIFKNASMGMTYTDILGSVWHIADKIGINRKHAGHVEATALSIFDQTKPIHKMGSKNRLFLQISAILHDAGNSISTSNHSLHTYSIIMAQSIMGLSDEELNFVASVAKYHSNLDPDLSHDNYKALAFKDRIAASKLSSIIKIAEALDLSHKQHVTGVRVENEGDVLMFIISSKDQTPLEEWEFEQKSKLFQEVMGVEVGIRSIK